MDRLMHAAEDGDTEKLYNCIREVDVRRSIDDYDKQHFIDETPLHITATKGHVDFAMALIYIKPSWGTKLNQEMYSPMHLAIQNGYNELVLALLAVDKDLIRVKGKNGYTALHYAIEKDNLEVLARFLKDCPNCLDDVTIWNETALHVAARNGKVKALEILARYIQRMYLYCTISKRHILNSKDRNGNTVLHIAASYTQPETQPETRPETRPEMISVLLECQANKTEMNKGGFTALELVQISEAPNKEQCLAIMRKRNGMKRIMRFPKPKQIRNSFLCRRRTPEHEPLHDKLRCEITLYEYKIRTWTNGTGVASMSSDKINALLVALAVILGATYQAVLNPPGGVWQGSYSANTTAAEAHVGQSVMTPIFFQIFFALNFLVFLATTFITLGLLHIVSSSSTFVAVVFELLLSLFVGCLVLAEQVVEPHEEPGSILTTADTLFFTFLSLCTYIVVTRLGTMAIHKILNPYPVSFFKRFFRDRVQTS